MLSQKYDTTLHNIYGALVGCYYYKYLFMK